MRLRSSLLGVVFSLCACGAPALDEGVLTEADLEISEAAGNGCLPCPTQSCVSPGTCLGRKVLTGNCSCPSGAYCGLSSQTVSVNPESYATATFTAWSGGGDVKYCTRQEIRRSFKDVAVNKTCERGVIIQTTWSGHRVRKQRGSVAGTFGNAGTCGLFETWGPWSAWQNE